MGSNPTGSVTNRCAAMDKKAEDLKNKHWMEILVDRLEEQKKPPFVITGGMTTSGPAHLGTVCEFLYPAVLKQSLESRGKKVEFKFVGDILDAFDCIPFELLKYTDELTPDLGKPLVHTRDPLECHKSFGEHYLEQAKKIMERMSLEIEVIEADKMYESGSMDKYAAFFLQNEGSVKEVVAQTSMKKVEDLKDWSPIMPICQKCGKIATTRVIWHSSDEYEYVCDKDVKYTTGCGFKGRSRIIDHAYKLQWRLHWPSWQALFNSSIEGSGMDHMTKGGSATTAVEVHKKLLGRDPPILFKYGFVLINGKKYSKSKGNGMTATELSNLVPPEMLKYALIVPNIEQNKDIDPTGDKLILLYNDIERISKIETSDERADVKKKLAFDVAIKKLSWKSSFLDILLNYQIYRDWDKVSDLVGDRDGVIYLSHYIEAWLSKGFAPERYNFSVKQSKIVTNLDAVRLLASNLKEGMGEVDVHNMIYEVAGNAKVRPEELFKSIYNAIIGKDSGPKLGKLIAAIGIKKVKEMLEFSVN